MKRSRINIIIAFFLTFAGYLVYSPSIKNDFVNWDDDKYILENPDIKSPVSLEKIFSSYYVGNFQPLVILSYAAEYSFFKLEARYYHKTNLFLHLLNTLLVFFLFYYLAGNHFISLVVSLTFLLHPLHVESVAWISERKDLLYALFYLMSLLLYLKYLKTKRAVFFIVSVMMFALSLLSKSAAVSLPFILFLFDYYQSRKFNLKLFVEKIPYILLAGIIGIIALYSQSEAGAIISLSEYSVWERILFFFYTLAQYLINFIYPYHCTILNFYPDSGSLPVIYFLSPFILAAIIFILLKLKKARKEIVFGSLFFLFSIFSVLQIIPVGNAITAGRYTYIPFLGLSFLVAYLCYLLIKNKPGLKYYIYGFFAVWFIFLTVKTINQIKIWKNGDVLFSKMIEEFPEKTLGYVNRGIALYYGYNESKTPDYKNAISNFTQALKINPNEVNAYFNRGNSYFQLSDFNKALSDFDQTILLDSLYFKAYNNKGLVLSVQYKDTAAIEMYNKAIKLFPDYSDAVLNRGISYYNLGNTDQACSDWRHAKMLVNQKAVDLLKQYCNEK